MVPADNLEALSICWVVFSRSENPYMCRAVQTQRGAGASPCSAGVSWRGASSNPAMGPCVGHISGSPQLSQAGCAHGVVTAAPVFRAQDE